jgi:hypothetical protein
MNERQKNDEMLPEERQVLQDLQRTALAARENLLHAISNQDIQEERVAAIPGITRGYYAKAKEMANRYPNDALAKTCLEQAETWLKDAG